MRCPCRKSGNVDRLPVTREPLLMPVVHALMQVREDLEGLVPLNSLEKRVAAARRRGVDRLSRPSRRRGARSPVHLRSW